MLYVEKDLSAIAHAIFSRWEETQNELNGKYLQASNARVTPKDIISSIQKGKVFNNLALVTDYADIKANSVWKKV